MQNILRIPSEPFQHNRQFISDLPHQYHLKNVGGYWWGQIVFSHQKTQQNMNRMHN